LSSVPDRPPARRRILAWVAAALSFCSIFLIVAPSLLPYGSKAALDGLDFSAVVLDREGEELQVVPLADGLRRIYVPSASIRPELARIVLGAEDRRFRWHPGFDAASLVRAAFQNASAGERVSGASTIGMQLARLIAPRPRGLGAKLAEAWEAMQLERRLGKDRVLELYLGLLPFGHNAEGFAAAARVFFGRDLADLGRYELMVLAVVPRSPSAYDPFGRRGSNEAAALRLAAALGEDAGAARVGIERALDRVLDPSRAEEWPFRAPHYLAWLQTRPEWKTRDRRLPVVTAIEGPLQSFLEDLLARTVEEAAKKRISNAAGIFLRPGDMSIAAWVGSIDFSDEAGKGQIDGVRMRRQPGSTLKPFLYSLALENGFTASTILPDVPTDFGGAEVYVPGNFNEQFNGPVRLRQALASSLNVPAVRTLERVGVLPFTELLIKDGFASLEDQRGRLGLGMALGNAEISLFELVQGYGIFLHGGRPAAIRALPGPALRSDAKGKARGEPLIDPRVAWIVRDILTRHPDRTLAFGRGGNTRLKFEGAIKTGTSNQFNNIWAVGFTTDLLGGVWMGNFGGQTVVGTADSGYPARAVSQTLESFSAHEKFPAASGLERVSICSLSGMRATDACPHSMEEWFLPGTAPPACDWHYRAASGSIGVRYPQVYGEWLARYRYRAGGAPGEPGEQGEGASFLDGSVRISKPLDGSVFFRDPGMSESAQRIRVEAEGSGAAALYLDGEIVARGRFPFSAFLPLVPGRHALRVSGGASPRASQGEMKDEIEFEVR
jgi:penicillin-binding protein 1C